jgi:branched-chain amino acid transport system permease protein
MVIYNSTRFLSQYLDIEPGVLGPLRMVAIGVIIILVILFLPRGLLPERKRRFDR